MATKPRCGVHCCCELLWLCAVVSIADVRSGGGREGCMIGMHMLVNHIHSSQLDVPQFCSGGAALLWSRELTAFQMQRCAGGLPGGTFYSFLIWWLWDSFYPITFGAFLSSSESCYCRGCNAWLEDKLLLVVLSKHLVWCAKVIFGYKRNKRVLWLEYKNVWEN